ncbi:hypothetical protein CN233_35200 [Sinorhizobium meliloti]|nr:hypothetical protein CN233_35200 [Sinorhizobium meliloti]RVL02819.1 hypothetical protein CN152_08410 [Sinorhizobium meliloti]RVN36478.1 hypothetical protein CN113_32660 [Sinorhizobium meliloti]RVQ07328.1 hypothetical protein CN069_02235 [Sinorhizobium meliloti]
MDVNQCLPRGDRILRPRPCAVIGVRAAPRLRCGRVFFQPKDLGGLDTCDRHRHEALGRSGVTPM